MVHPLAAEADLLGLIHLGDEPGVAQAQPVVGLLHLLAVHDLLLEDAQLVADGIAGSGDLQGGHGVQVAGGQTAQAAVAQAGVRLLLKQVGGREAQVLQRVLQGIQKAQIVGVLFQGTAHQKFQRQVVDLALLALPHLIACLHLVAGHDVTEHQCAGLEHMVGGGVIHVAPKVAAELADDHLGKLGLGIFSHSECLPFHKIKSKGIGKIFPYPVILYQIFQGASMYRRVQKRGGFSRFHAVLTRAPGIGKWKALRRSGGLWRPASAGNALVNIDVFLGGVIPAEIGGHAFLLQAAPGLLVVVVQIHSLPDDPELMSEKVKPRPVPSNLL